MNPDDIKISDLTVEKVPYRIVQDPGAGNALGKIKFIFNNPFGIYLHDTPNDHRLINLIELLVTVAFVLNNLYP